MRASSFLLTTQRSSANAECVSADLSVRAGLTMQVAAGHHALLPIGARVVGNIETIVRDEMNRAGAVELRMPIMQPAALWQESGRWSVYGKDMFKLKNRSDRDFCLGPTHEELIVSLVRPRLQSYKELPFTLFQLGTKFRDELRAKGGLIRAKEFMMKDAYSFDLTDDGSSSSYAKMREAYIRIFQRTGINAIPISANPGEIGGNFSEEFIAEAAAGEDRFFIDGEGTAHKVESDQDITDPSATVLVGIEVGHIFKLGTRYSEAMGLRCADSQGRMVDVIMGCYGIGISRLLAVILEQNHDNKGIIWPKEVRPFDGGIVAIRYNEEIVRRHADAVHDALCAAGLNVLLDDRDLNAGVKFKDADLLGIPYKLIVGPQTVAANSVECEDRITGEKHSFSLDTVAEDFRRLLV